jgi:RHS repeat-associated protein
LFAGTGTRTTNQWYAANAQQDGQRKQFTSKERDAETGLDYFLARYYSAIQGRFTSPDEFTGGPDELYDFTDKASDNPTFYADLTNPQSLNKYQYTYNNPLRYTDSDGHCPMCPVVEELLESPAGQQIIQKATPYVVAGAAAVAAYASGAFDYVKNGLKKIQANADSSYVCGDFLECGYIQQFKKEAASPAQAQPQAPPQASQAKEHTKDARPSTEEKHEEGEARKTKDRGGEKGDKKRRPPRKRHDDHIGPWPPKPVDPNSGDPHRKNPCPGCRKQYPFIEPDEKKKKP